MTQRINQQSSSEDKKRASEGIFEVLSEVLFDKVNYLNNPGNTNSSVSADGGTISTTLYRVQFRVPDTAAGKYLNPSRKSRLRTVCYVAGGVEAAEFYLLSPTRYQSTAGLGTDQANLDIFQAYVGVKVDAGVVSLASRFAGSEKLNLTAFRMVGETTYLVEIFYNITYAEVYIDSKSIGTIACDFSENFYNQVTFFPIFAPIKSKAGVRVNFNAENYQFIQDK